MFSVQINIQVIPLLSDEEMTRLGVTCLGDRVVLKNICKNMQSKEVTIANARPNCCHYYHYTFFIPSEQENVTAEMQNIFPSMQGSSSTQKDSESHETVLARAERMLTQLRSKPVDSCVPNSRRRRKKSYAIGKKVKDVQRNVVVIDYHGANPPAVHTLHEYDKVYQGVLVCNSKMSEDDIRAEICMLIHQETSDIYDFSTVGPTDFEFVKCINKHVRALGGKGVYDGDGLRELYRSGGVYVRLMRSFYKHKVFCFFKTNFNTMPDSVCRLHLMLCVPA